MQHCYKMASAINPSIIMEKLSIIIPKRIAVISVGLPGVGKSTLLKALVQKISNSTILDKDTINSTLLRDYPYSSDYYKKYVRDQSYELLLSLAKDNLTTQKIVFLDGFFGDKLKTTLLSNFLDSSDFEIKFLFFFCTLQVNKSRLLERGNPRDEEKLKDFENYYDSMLFVHQKEIEEIPHLMINTEEEMSSNISKIVHYLAS